MVNNGIQYGTGLSAAPHERCARFLDSHDIVRVGAKYLANNSAVDNLADAALLPALYKKISIKTSLITNNQIGDVLIDNYMI